MKLHEELYLSHIVNRKGRVLDDRPQEKMKLKDIHSNSRGNKQLKGDGDDIKPILRLLISKEGSRTEIKSMVWIRITVTRRGGRC